VAAGSPPGQVDGADDGFHRVGQDGCFVTPAGALLAAAQEHEVAQPQRPGNIGQGAHVDHCGPQLGEPALGQVRVCGVQAVGHHEPQHRVAKELKALVVRQPTVLVGVGTVCQCTQKQRFVDRLTDHLEEAGGQPVDGPL